MYFKNTFKRNGRFTNLYFVGTLDCTKGKKYKNFETLTVSWCTKNTKEREREREKERAGTFLPHKRSSCSTKTDIQTQKH